MHILIQIPSDEHFVVEPDGLAPEEFLRLPEGGVALVDLRALGVEDEGVRDPAVVAAEDQDF